MPEQSANPITSVLVDHFELAVFDYPQWSPQQEVRKFWIDQKFISVADLCVLVEQHTGQLPEIVYGTLRSYMGDYPDGELRKELEADQSYPTGARCLRKMMERRKAANR